VPPSQAELDQLATIALRMHGDYGPMVTALFIRMAMTLSTASSHGVADLGLGIIRDHMGEPQMIRVGALTINFRIEGKDSNGSVAVFETIVPSRGRPPAPHSHDGYEETIYGLEGVTTWTIDGTQTEIGPGDTICILRGQVHEFDNHGDSDAKVLAVVTPGVLGPDFFREMGAVIATADGSPPDREKIGEVMRRHGLTPAS
jgi:quercetin dioxygenase-like cupin family protein